MHQQARLFKEQGDLEKAESQLEQVVAIETRARGPDSFSALSAEDDLAWLRAQQGKTNEAAQSFTNLFHRMLKSFPGAGFVNRCYDHAGFFAQHHRFDEAREIFGAIKDSLGKLDLDRPYAFNQLVGATAAVDGWSSAAEVCRRDYPHLSNSLLDWLTRAWVFRYVGDEIGYRKIVEKVLAMDFSRISPQDQHVPIEIAALGSSFEPSTNQLIQLNSQIRFLEGALPTRPADQQAWAYRAIAQFQFRRQEYAKCLDALEHSISRQTSADPYNLLIQAACLHCLERPAEARELLQEAVALSDSQLPQPLPETEPFLVPSQLYQHLVMRRETEALLAETKGGVSQ